MISLIILLLLDGFIIVILGLLIYFIVKRIRIYILISSIIFILTLLLTVLFHINSYSFKIQRQYNAIIRTAIENYYEEYSKYPKDITDLKKIKEYDDRIAEISIFLTHKINLFTRVSNDTFYYTIYSYGNDFDDDSLIITYNDTDDYYLLPFKNGDIKITSDYVVNITEKPKVHISNEKLISISDLSSFFKNNTSLKNYYIHSYGSEFTKPKGFVLISFTINSNGDLINFKDHGKNQFEKKFAKEIIEILANANLKKELKDKIDIVFPFSYY